MKKEFESGNDLIASAIKKRKESRSLEFKERFDTSSLGGWCEIIKDVVAISNSGGGLVIFGVKDDGSLASFDSSALRKIDSATIQDKLKKYTGEFAPEVDVVLSVQGGNFLVGFSISAALSPIAFINPGTYDVPGGKQEVAFRKGMVYFRHGAKSEPGTSRDLLQFQERVLKRERDSWKANVRRVVAAPRGSKIQVIEAMSPPPTGHAPILVQVTNDPGAPKMAAINYDQSHPNRMTELVKKVNEKLSPKLVVSSHDLCCIRKLYGTDENTNFYFKPLHGTPQYSDAFASWIVTQAASDPLFFDSARKACKGLKRGERPKRINGDSLLPLGGEERSLSSA